LKTLELQVKIFQDKDLGAAFSAGRAAFGWNRLKKKGWAATDAVIPASAGEPPICFSEGEIPN
jgi:hypothetical protein